MTRRAYFVCSVVIRGQGGTSFKFNEKWQIHNFRCKIFWVRKFLYVRFRSNIFFIKVQLFWLAHAKNGLRRKARMYRKAGTKIVKIMKPIMKNDEHRKVQ